MPEGRRSKLKCGGWCRDAFDPMTRKLDEGVVSPFRVRREELCRPLREPRDGGDLSCALFRFRWR
jgi:hypothetical protein